ncbi:MAG: NAD(P)-dependent alcohol dehydrogenase [Cyclobacteriaceae bacterium]|nr:NAD(P)-dependent alcohol dehydrogenase [Cyclobacteriaceae bacterium]
MKAVIYKKFGSPDVLQLAEVEKPKPAENEILLKVHATSANAYDWRHLRADPFLIHFMGAGLFKPKHPILGADMAGTVEAVGTNVKSFKPGDRVFGEGGYGGFAEYACAGANRFVMIPEGISFEEAAAAPMAALTSLQGLRDKGKIKAGDKVLVNGASGGVGSFAVQIAKSFDAEVTGVCSTSKVDFVRSLGADHVLDYRSEDITRSGKKYDLILDIAAYRPSADYKRILQPGGMYVMIGGSIGRIFSMMFKSIIGNRNMTVMIAEVKQADLEDIAGMLGSGKIRSVIDKQFPLEKTAEALRYLEQGKVCGKVVVRVGS